MLKSVAEQTRDSLNNLMRRNTKSYRFIIRDAFDPEFAPMADMDDSWEVVLDEDTI